MVVSPGFFQCLDYEVGLETTIPTTKHGGGSIMLGATGVLIRVEGVLTRSRY